MMNTNNDASRLQQVARNESLTALARLVQIIGVPAGLAFLAWLAIEVSGMDEKFAETNGKIDAVSVKVSGMDMRVSRLETWQDSQRGPR